MLTYEKELQFIVMEEYGCHEFYSEEEKDFYVKCLEEDGFEKEKDFVIYQKVWKMLNNIYVI